MADMTPPPFHLRQKKSRPSKVDLVATNSSRKPNHFLRHSLRVVLLLAFGAPGHALSSPCAFELGTIFIQRTRSFRQAGPAGSPSDLIDSKQARESADFAPSANVAAPLAVQEAVWTDPAGVARLLSPLPLSPGALSAGESFDTPAFPDPAFPAGTNRFAVTTARGPMDFDLPYPESGYPVPVHVTQFDSLQRAEPGKDLRVAIAPIPLEARSHLLSVGLVDPSQPSTILFSESIAWSAPGGTITLPGRFLEPERDYVCTLTIQKVVTVSASLARTTAGQTVCLVSGVLYQSLTEIPLKTLPLPPTPPRLSLRVELDPARAIIEITALPGQRLRLEAASDPRSWTSLLETNVTEAKVQHVEPLRPDDGVRMFRAVYP